MIVLIGASKFTANARAKLVTAAVAAGVNGRLLVSPKEG